MNTEILKQYGAIQDNILNCKTYAHVQNCRDWVARFEQRFNDTEAGDAANRLKELATMQEGYLRAKYAPVAGLEDIELADNY